MKADLNSLTPEENNTLACHLGEIQRHLAEDTKLIDKITELGINLDSEMSGYDCLISALHTLQQHADANL